MTTMNEDTTAPAASVAELRTALREYSTGGYPATLVKHLLDALDAQDAQDAAEKDVWTVLGIWDNDQAVPIGAIAGRHSVHGEAPGDRIRDELFEAQAEFYGFDTSSFYEQGVWATSVTAPDGDTAQDEAVAEMMRAQHGDDWEPGCHEDSEDCQGGTCNHPDEPGKDG